jgi:hypothetical protein
VRIVVDAQDEVGEFLRECGRLVSVAEQAAQLVRLGCAMRVTIRS